MDDIFMEAYRSIPEKESYRNGVPLHEILNKMPKQADMILDRVQDIILVRGMNHPEEGECIGINITEKDSVFVARGGSYESTK